MDAIPVLRNVFILRWNPEISSFNMDGYRDATTQYPDGFCFNWSIYEWEKAHEGDLYVMYCTTGPMQGIVFSGEFLTEPYTGDDWAGKGRKRYYADITCNHAITPNSASPINIDILQKTFPNIDWSKGHSGELLQEEDARKMLGLIEDYFGIIYDRCRCANIEEEDEEDKEK